MDGCKGKREVESMSDAVTDKPTVPGQDPPPPAGTRAVEVGGGGVKNRSATDIFMLCVGAEAFGHVVICEEKRTIMMLVWLTI